MCDYTFSLYMDFYRAQHRCVFLHSLSPYLLHDIKVETNLEGIFQDQYGKEECLPQPY